MAITIQILLLNDYFENGRKEGRKEGCIQIQKTWGKALSYISLGRGIIEHTGQWY
jgi:hypothetical protein